MRMIECRELIEAVTERYEETLLAPTRYRVQAHLDACPGCRAFVARHTRWLSSSWIDVVESLDDDDPIHGRVAS